MPTPTMRRLGRVRDEGPFLVVAVILLSAVGYLVIWPEHWRRGVGGIVLALLVAGVLRVVLPNSRAGMLAVRAKWFDAICYLSLGVVILAVALRLHWRRARGLTSQAFPHTRRSACRTTPAAEKSPS